MTPKQVSLNHSAMPTSPKGINLVKNLDLTLALPSGSQRRAGHPTAVETLCSGLRHTLHTFLLSTQFFWPRLGERVLTLGLRKTLFAQPGSVHRQDQPC